MTDRTVTHATIVVERTYDAPPARVFAALADPEARARWSVPSDDQGLVYDEANFRVGGHDVFRCGPAGDLMFRVTTRYEDIVPDQRIISVETVNDETTRLSVSLITVEVFPEHASASPGTRLVLTDQITSFGGADMVAGSEAGFGAALDNLARELRREPAEPDPFPID